MGKPRAIPINEKRQPVFVALKPGEREAVEALAASQERTLSSQIRIMVLDALRAQKKSRADNPAL